MKWIVALSAVIAANASNASEKSVKCGFSESIVYGNNSTGYINTDLTISVNDGFYFASRTSTATKDSRVKLTVQLWEPDRTLQLSIEDSSVEALPQINSNRSCENDKSDQVFYVNYSKVVPPLPGTNVSGRVFFNLACPCF